jgi:hypothetical protein
MGNLPCSLCFLCQTRPWKAHGAPRYDGLENGPARARADVTGARYSTLLLEKREQRVIGHSALSEFTIHMSYMKGIISRESRKGTLDEQEFLGYNRLHFVPYPCFCTNNAQAPLALSS